MKEERYLNEISQSHCWCASELIFEKVVSDRSPKVAILKANKILKIQFLSQCQEIVHEDDTCGI